MALTLIQGGKNMNQRRLFGVVATVIILLVLLWSSGSLVENLAANDIMVIQSPVKGELAVYTTPGIKWQGFGKVTKYRKRDQFWFTVTGMRGDGETTKQDESIKVRFNDGGHGSISGSIAWEMPVGTKEVIALHMKYGSHDAIKHQLVRTVLEKSVYMTGPLMSSTESYAEKRNELLNIIEDQMSRGVYSTEAQQVRKPDPITGAMKTVTVASIVLDSNKQPMRAEESPLKEFSIRTFNLSINEVRYDNEVEKQIQQQQQAIMQVQIAGARAKEAEQNAITAMKQGEASAMKAKWEQEVIKAREVTAAEQRLQVAQLETKAAEQFKLAETLKGEGEGARRRLVMEADGALSMKLDAYRAVNAMYAEAIHKYAGPWVPNVVMGATTEAASGAHALIELLTAKTAKELSLDLSVPAQPSKRK